MIIKSKEKDALRDTLVALGDDELILGHRASEWCGHAPILEEDIAFANLALDEIGHAQLWYNLIAELEGKDRNQVPDQLIFWRQASDFRNAQLLELPIGDWAFSILRQYLFDSAESERLKVLALSNYKPLAEVAEKIRVEELYHLRHTQAWVLRLGQGTTESRKRMQSALDMQWRYTAQLFTLTGDPERLFSLGIDLKGAYSSWRKQVSSLLIKSGLNIPKLIDGHLNRSDHTEHLVVLVREMQSVARLDPHAQW